MEISQKTVIEAGSPARFGFSCWVVHQIMKSKTPKPAAPKPAAPKPALVKTSNKPIKRSIADQFKNDDVVKMV